MRIKIESGAILQEAQKVIGVINPKNTLPILSNILIETEKNNIKLIGTDLDIGIITTVNGDIIEDGAITIPARRFVDILKELPETKIDIYTKKNNMVIIETESVVFKVLGVPKEEFPKIPAFTEKEQFVLGQALFKKMLDTTIFATSRDETRYVLNGVCFVVTKNYIKTIATDGRRLAIYTKENRVDFETTTGLIIPLKTAQTLQHLLKDAGEVRVVFSKNQAMFKVDDVIIISRLIEGEFPNYEQVIPKEAKNKLRVETKALLSAIRRASILVTPESQAVKLHIQKNRLTVSKVTPEIGEVKEDLTSEYDGEEFVIGFNPTYLLEVLKVIGTEKVEIELSGPEKPGAIRTNGEYIYIVLPMQVV